MRNGVQHPYVLLSGITSGIPKKLRHMPNVTGLRIWKGYASANEAIIASLRCISREAFRCRRIRGQNSVNAAVVYLGTGLLP